MTKHHVKWWNKQIFPWILHDINISWNVIIFLSREIYSESLGMVANRWNISPNIGWNTTDDIFHQTLGEIQQMKYFTKHWVNCWIFVWHEGNFHPPSLNWVTRRWPNFRGSFGKRSNSRVLDLYNYNRIYFIFNHHVHCSTKTIFPASWRLWKGNHEKFQCKVVQCGGEFNFFMIDICVTHISNQFLSH